MINNSKYHPLLHLRLSLLLLLPLLALLMRSTNFISVSILSIEEFRTPLVSELLDDEMVDDDATANGNIASMDFDFDDVVTAEVG
jgi:hypothetical protein